jgi:hypothetical protein
MVIVEQDMHSVLVLEVDVEAVGDEPTVAAAVVEDCRSAPDIAVDSLEVGCNAPALDPDYDLGAAGSSGSFAGVVVARQQPSFRPISSLSSSLVCPASACQSIQPASSAHICHQTCLNVLDLTS